MRALAYASAAAVVLCLIPGERAAAQTDLRAELTNANETAPVVPTLVTGEPRAVSFGTLTATLNADQTALFWTAVIHNIDVTGTQTDDPNDNLVAAHIHNAPPGVNGPVVWGFFGAPMNDVNPANTTLVPFATGVGGTFTGTWDLNEGNGGTNLTAQIPNILAGNTYMNFHTTQFPAGEIRGNLAVVPEPSTVLLLGSGLALVGLGAGRRGRRGRNA